MKHIPNIDDFIFIFESQGTPFIFEDLVAEFYVPNESISFCRNNIKKVYFSKDTIGRMNKQGMQLSLKEIKDIIVSLKKTIGQAKKEASDFFKKENFTQHAAQHAFSVMGKICRQYFYFDFCFWDKTFELSKTDKQAQIKVQLIQDFKNKIRADLDPIFFGKQGYLLVLLNKVSKQTKVPKDILQWYCYKEIISLLDGKKVSKKEIKARSEYVYNKTTDLVFLSSVQAHNFINRFLRENKRSFSQEILLEGKTAHSIGKKIVGKVKIIFRHYANPEILRKSMTSMKRGQILVSQTTDPKLLPAMKKAAAIVTDVGGLLSHAAITSRELNTPCVVGTQIATKVLKDGDLVEVDADKGIVRKLT